MQTQFNNLRSNKQLFNWVQQLHIVAIDKLTYNEIYNKIQEMIGVLL